ncbi:neutral/alkaline nonlysosomal ceramidase [Planomonospora sphaerica]|uniref:Neutral ceramidase n=1 Tax=Planomonospora sphaerica TaxID=161355 RepID=A0A161LLS1_9ACTN|nr:neutral/alkaline ceramidase [Planomonospora sphaerica]GAT68015.1 neutral/alkaline nonlysosomal ceramidase [Planomonospora sphaerica]
MRLARPRTRTLTLLLTAALGVAVPPAPPVAAGTGPAGTAATAEPSGYLVGRGISDVTGEIAEVGMMGYSSFEQKASGLHQRQRSRAFVVVDRATGRRVAYVNADLAMIFEAVRQQVIARLKQRYGTLYTEQNVLLSATHTHAGPGGFSHHLAYNLASLGFQKGTYGAIVDGIVESVAEAHDDLRPGTVTLGRGELTDASVNRSRAAFDRNPAQDRAAFPGGIDPAMTVLRFRQGGADVGAISWFATHNTSLTNANTLVSPDNKGYAAYRWEHDHAGVRYLDPGPGFVAAFPNTNAGDMSPNLNLRPGSGPTEDEFANTRIIGERQFAKARQIYDGATTPVTGGVDSRMRFVDMENVAVDGRYTPDGRPGRTCTAMVGASTLAGSTEDGPAIPGFREGMTGPIGRILASLDVPPPASLLACQAPKANLVPTGLITEPVRATPNVLPLQILRIGQLYLVAGPAEYTIVSGLRIRRSVAAELGVPPENVLLQGYANAYSQYVTTPEEYALQQYEGGSTLYGPHTLPAHQQEFARLAAALRDGAPVDPGTAPPDLSGAQFTLQTGVVLDSAPPSTSFGQVLTEPAAAHRRGETVTAEFVTGHPKNDLHRNGTYLEVQRLVDGTWRRHLDDGDWHTKFRWTRLNAVTGTSKATVTWDVAADTPPGTYRIVHFGDRRNLLGRVTPFTGVSRTFTVS